VKLADPRKQQRDVELSVLIPVGRRAADLEALFAEYRAGLEQLGRPYEVVFILDGARTDSLVAVEHLQQQYSNVVLIRLTKGFGEATALMVGLEQASGVIVLTLPAYHQIEGSEIPKLVAALGHADLVIAHRTPRAGAWFERVRRDAFHGMVRFMTRLRFRDLGCSARAMKRRVLEEISIYGDQHRFLPILADQHGFRVAEIDVRQSPKDRFAGRYTPREYTQRLLDVLTVFFLVRFTKKPLRFFGMIGAIMFGLGALVLLDLVVERQFFAHPLADRPALLLASLLAVLGLQLFAIGLLGELIIFTHARDIKDYQIESITRLAGTLEHHADDALIEHAEHTGNAR
jgi:glycosyltransferase involved in cell wall biosynthesis